MPLSHLAELDQDQEVYLFSLTKFNPANPSDRFDFTANFGVHFAGIGYQALDCSIDAVEFTSQGTQPQPQLTVADTAQIVTNLIATLGNLEGANVKVTLTQKRYLDGQPYANPNGIKAQGDWVIARRAEHVPGDTVVFVLSNPLDWNGTTVPSRYVLQKCGWRYRDAALGCPYALPKKFTIAGDRTFNPALDVCGKTVDDCKLRFGENAVLPFGGFPAATRR